ncbi:peptide deformylase [Dactylosporangium sp. NPDC049140]|uniref:peptide deformylase n=1 Tax=Dactylosporangium sp. NPDC049140 TaxID=3155647 RepID=UPI0033D84D69
MTTRPIRMLGDPVLRSPAAAVTAFDAALRDLVRDLFDTLDAEPGRAGLAAPQLGVAARVFVYGTRAGRGHLVNPQVAASSGGQIGDEGCLSVPGLAFPTPRALEVTVAGFDERGEPVTVTGSGFLARALQHECDHLDGVLYMDTLTGDVRRQALRAVRAAFPPTRRGL